MSTGTTHSSTAKQASTSGKGQLEKESNDVREDFKTLVDDVSASIHTYCKKRPQMAGLMIFTVGLYVGWKIKPW